MMTKEKICELFREVGMDEKQMNKFHQLFEERYPEEHQSFLEWLRIPEKEITTIRRNAGCCGGAAGR